MIFINTGNFIAAFTTIFFVLGLGFVIQKKKPFSQETLSQLSNLVVSVVMPLYIFYATATNTTLTLLYKAPIIILIGAAVPFLIFITAPLFGKLLKVPEAQQPVFSFSMMFSNTAFLGIPICGILFGSEGAFYAVMYNFGLTLIIYSFGIWSLTGGDRKSFLNVFKNSLIWSMLVGILFVVLKIEMPIWISQPLSTIGDATLPIALLVAGAQIGNVRLEKNEYTPQVIFVTLSRLIIMPGILLLVFYGLHWSNMEHQVMILQTAMPVGIASTILANRYHADGQFTAIVTLWSTLLALITLPLIAFLFFF